MPIFIYECRTCEVEFEEFIVHQEDTKKYSEHHPCPECKRRAKRIKVNSVSFSFKAPNGQTQGSGVHGQSGVHDLDYPSLDKAIGRSSTKKWEYYYDRKKARDKARRELGTNAVKQVDGVVTALDSQTADFREKGLKTLRKAKDQNSKMKSGVR